MRMTTTCEAKPLYGDCPERQIDLGRRRLLFFSLVGATILVLAAGLGMVLLEGGLTVLELAMLALFALNLPWIAIGLWNSAIGFVLLRVSRDSLRNVVPLAGLDQRPAPPAGRIAIVMPVHDEDPASVFRCLKSTVASLDATGRSRAFDIFLLSDTQDERLAFIERVLFTTWKRSDHRPGRLHYRRRLEKSGFKAGNLRDFCNRWGRAYDFMVVLDADSTMSGAAILRLVGLMQANPKLGILQTLVVGLPSTSAFTRIFQFGMRHGMRTYTMGSAWWQGDAGPYWGHNAIIRLAPFIEHCRLPTVPGSPPLGGEVLSHDQIEAVSMRRAGWEVRVWPCEDGSFETNPPTLIDFIQRDLRWAHGNMQYWRLLALAGAHWLGGLQMLLAISMYTWAACWAGFCALGLMRLICPTLGSMSGRLLPEPAGLPTEGLPVLSLALFIIVVACAWAPKLFGVLQALSDRVERRKYGGAGKLLVGAGVELCFSTLLAPVIIVAQTIFLIALLSGRGQGWASQRRGHQRVSPGYAARKLWLQTLLGTTAALLLLIFAPSALLPWAAPILAGLLLAVPFAVATTSPGLGRLLRRARLCAVPEEISPSPEVRAVCRWLSAADAYPDPRQRATDRMSADAVS